MVRINIVVKIELAKYAVVTGGWLDWGRLVASVFYLVFRITSMTWRSQRIGRRDQSLPFPDMPPCQGRIRWVCHAWMFEMGPNGIEYRRFFVWLLVAMQWGCRAPTRRTRLHIPMLDYGSIHEGSFLDLAWCLSMVSWFVILVSASNFMFPLHFFPGRAFRE